VDAGTLQLSGLCPLLSGVGKVVAKEVVDNRSVLLKSTL